ncbi:hypothetical protein H6F73_24095 [Microcoleus sp. FACHB-68]|nr:hypothetical protein [Microcoleus sp. FACHB-68]
MKIIHPLFLFIQPAPIQKSAGNLRMAVVLYEICRYSPPALVRLRR